MSLEESLEQLGGVGKYQLLTFLVLGVTSGWTSIWQLFAIIFIGNINPRHCNNSPNKTLEESIPYDESSDSYSACEQYVDLAVDNSTTACSNGWNYSADGFDPGDGTICMEWDLVCDKESWVELSQTLFNVGVLVGYAFFTPLSDRFGRKKVFFVCLFLMDVFGIALAFSPNFVAFCVFQFLTGAFGAGLYMQGFVMCCELFPCRVRTYMSPLIVVFYSTGMALLAPWAYFLRNWRWLQLAISVTGFLPCLLMFWTSESIFWLVAHGREEEAKKIIKKAAKFNNVKLKDEDINLTDENIGDVKTASIWKVLKSPRPRRYTFIMVLISFVNNLTFFGVSLMMGAMAGNVYLNFFINATVDVPALPIAISAMAWLGRRYPLTFFQILVGILMIISAVCSTLEFQSVDKGVLISSLAFASKFAMTGVFCGQIIFSLEIFPTNARSSMLGLVSGAGFIGGVCAPYTVYLYRIVPWIPNTIYGVLSLIAGVSTLWAPETLGRPLPTTVEETAAWSILPSSEERQAFKDIQMKARNRSHNEDQTSNQNRIPSSAFHPETSVMGINPNENINAKCTNDGKGKVI